MERVKEIKQIPDGAEKKIKFENYLFVFRIFGLTEFSCVCTDCSTYQIYTLDTQSISKIKVDTIFAALEKKDPSRLTAKVVHSTPGCDDSFLTVTISAKFEYIPEIEESFTLFIKKDVNEEEILKIQLLQSGEELAALNRDLEQLKGKLGKAFSVGVEEASYSGQSDVIANLMLPKGRYDVQICFFARANSQWLYLKLDKNGQDCLQIPQQGWYLHQQNASNFGPQSVRCILTVEKDQE